MPATVWLSVYLQNENTVCILLFLCKEILWPFFLCQITGESVCEVDWLQVVGLWDDRLPVSLAGQWLLAEHSTQAWATSYSRAYPSAGWEWRRSGCRQAFFHSCPPMRPLPTQHGHLHPGQGAPTQGVTPIASAWPPYLRGPHVCQDSICLRENSWTGSGPAGGSHFRFMQVASWAHKCYVSKGHHQVISEVGLHVYLAKLHTFREVNT